MKTCLYRWTNHSAHANWNDNIWTVDNIVKLYCPIWNAWSLLSTDINFHVLESNYKNLSKVVSVLELRNCWNNCCYSLYWLDWFETGREMNLVTYRTIHKKSIFILFQRININKIKNKNVYYFLFYIYIYTITIFYLKL